MPAWWIVCPLTHIHCDRARNRSDTDYPGRYKGDGKYYPTRYSFSWYVEKKIKLDVDVAEKEKRIDELLKVYQQLIGLARNCNVLCYPSYYGESITDENKKDFEDLLRKCTLHMVASCVSDIFCV